MQHTNYHLIKGFDTMYASLYLIWGFFLVLNTCPNCFGFTIFFLGGGGYELHIYILKEPGGRLE